MRRYSSEKNFGLASSKLVWQYGGIQMPDKPTKETQITLRKNSLIIHIKPGQFRFYLLGVQLLPIKISATAANVARAKDPQIYRVLATQGAQCRIIAHMWNPYDTQEWRISWSERYAYQAFLTQGINSVIAQINHQHHIKIRQPVSAKIAPLQFI